MACPDFPVFWIRLIRLIVQTVKAKNDEDINENAYESLKNLLLVVKSEERLSTEVWMQTWEEVDKTLSGLRQEIDPQQPEEVETEETQAEESKTEDS